MVVIGLLGALLLLGLMTFTISSQEETNAEYFADSSKVWSSQLDRETLFDWGLRQLILGADPRSESQSVLWGGRHSLLPTMFGRDLAPYSGQGIRLTWDSSTNRPALDMDHDGLPDGNPSFDLNFSPAAQQQTLDLAGLPDPDGEYTYPDINSSFISYRAQAPGGSGTVPVHLPTFHRPQYLRNVAASSNWYTAASTVRQMLRPHAEHLAVDREGRVTNSRRFVSGAYPETREDGTAMPAFSFSTINDGVWSGAPGNASAAAYDVDADGDGFKEAIWVDLGFPVQERTTPDGIETFVPLFAFTVVCADSLFNLNAHGNLYGDVNVNAPNFGAGRFVSQSQQAQSAAEVNPLWGLETDPGSLSASELEQYQRFFNHAPIDRIELANMDWWFLLNGRAQINSGNTVDVLYPGRWGEVARLRNATVEAGGTVRTTKPTDQFPQPGDPLQDDNGNAQEGGRFDGFGNVRYPAWMHPLNLYGRGTGAMNFGKSRLLAEYGPHRWPQYRNHLLNPTIGLLTLNNAPGAVSGQRLLEPFPTSPFLQFNEPGESFLEPVDAVDQPLDQIFGADDAAALHLSDADRLLIGLSGRVTTLASANFTSSPLAEQIRRRYTPVSWDVKTYGKPVYPPEVDPGTGTVRLDARRMWEFLADTDSDNAPEFPPVFIDPATGSPAERQPFRSELRTLLMLERSGQQPPPVVLLQRALSLNHVLDRQPNQQLRFRPLTPHAGEDLDGNGVIDAGETVLPNTPIMSRIDSSNPPRRPEDIGGDSFKQEYLARRDRQLLCRDIYVLLYTLGGGNDGRIYTTDNSGGQLYSFDPSDPRGDQCRRMAQFAVNWVDALDPDDTITLFEYDVNLANGWNVDDDPFGDPAADPRPAERGLVYGVEAQQLAFNEALAIFAKRVTNNGTATDHPATEYDDSENRDFTYVELENVGPRSVSFDSEAWQIAVEPVVDPGSTLLTSEPRRLTFQTGTVEAGTNSMLTIGTAGDADNTSGMSVLPSFFRVNERHRHPTDDPGEFTTIAPRSGLDLDLITDPIDSYRVNEAPSAPNAFGDGPEVASEPASGGGTPSGADLLHLELTDPDGITEADEGNVAAGTGFASNCSCGGASIRIGPLPCRVRMPITKPSRRTIPGSWWMSTISGSSSSPPKWAGSRSMFNCSLGKRREWLICNRSMRGGLSGVPP